MKPSVATAIGVSLMAVTICGAQQPVDSFGDPLPQGAIQRLGTLKMRYGSVSALAYLPDGRGVVLTGPNVDIWDLAAGTVQSSTQVAKTTLTSVEMRPDGKVMLLGDASGIVYEWDPETKEIVRSWATEQAGLRSARYSPDGTRFLVAGTSPLGYMEYDLETGGKTAGGGVEFATTRCGAIYGPDGATVIMGGGYAHLLEHRVLATGELLGKFASNYEAKEIRLSPDRTCVLVGVESCAEEYKLSDYSLLHRYDPVPGEAGRCYTHGFAGMRNEAVLGLRTGSIHRYDRVSGKEVLRWMAHPSVIMALAVSPDEKYVLTYGGGLLVESDMDAGRPRLQWDRHGGPVQAVAFTPSGDRVISGSEDATLRVWDARSGKSLLRIEGATLGAYTLAVSPDGSRTAAGCKDGIIREFSLTDGTLLTELKGHLGFVRSVAYTHDGARIVSSADDGSVRIWSLKGDEEPVVLKGHLGGVLSAAVSADDSQVLSGGRDGTVRLWDIAQAREIKQHTAHRGWVEVVAFAGQGTWAVSTGRDGKVARWDSETGEVVADIDNGGWTYDMVISPDGSRAYCTAGTGANCWNLADGQKLAELRGHASGTLGLAVSPDGSLLATGASDTSVLVWVAPAGQ